MSTHHRAWCLTCKAAWSGPDAHRNARRHQNQSANAPVPHPTESRWHLRNHCTEACLAEKETRA